MVIKKKNNNNIQSRDRPINNVDSENKNVNSIGLVKYHPDFSKVLYCYPNSKSVFYGDSVGKEFELLKQGSHENTITLIDIGGKKKCATASYNDNRVIIFNCNSDDCTEIKTLSNPTSIQFNPTQSYLAVGLSSGQLKYYPVINVNQATTINNAHDQDIVCLSFSRDGNHLASIGIDCKLKIWSTDSFENNNPEPIHIIDIDSSSEVLSKIGISWRSDQKELTIPTRSGLINSIIFDENDMSNDYKTRTFGREGHTKEAIAVEWDSEGKHLASIGLDSNLFIWNGDIDESTSDDPIYSYKHSSQINSFSWRFSQTTNIISFFDKSRLNTIKDFLAIDNVNSSSQTDNTATQDDVDDFDFDFDVDQNENEINSKINEKKNLRKMVQKDEESDQEMNDDDDDITSATGGADINEDEDNEIDGDNEDNESNYSQQQNRIYENYQQEAFQIGSTLLNVLNNPKSSNLKTKRYFMAYNMLGKIIKREENQSSNESSSIEIEFHETGFHKKITFSDKNHNLRLASLGPNGAIFATKYLANEREEYEQKQEELIEKQKNSDDQKSFSSQIKPLESIIMFKPFDTLSDGCEWSLVDTDEIEGVAISKNYIISVSSNKTLRLFSLGGIQLNLFTIPGDLVTMNTFEDTLVIVYHRSGSTINDNQSMNIWWINLANGNQIYHDHLSISTNSSLLWVGFSDNGLLTTMDSLGLVRQLSNGWFTSSPSTSAFLQWTIIMDLRKCEKSHSLDLYTYWVIGLNKTDLYSIFCSGYPLPPKCTHNYVKIETPLLSSSDTPILNNERDYLKSKFNLTNLVNQNQNNLNSRCTLSYEDLMKPLDDALLLKHLTDLDSSALRLFNHYTKLGRYQKAIDLCKTLTIKKSLQIAFTISNEQRLPWLSKKIVELIENFKPFKLDNNISNNNINNINNNSNNNNNNSNNSSPKIKSKQQSDNESNNESDNESDNESNISSPPPKSKSNISSPLSKSKSTTKSVKKAPFLIKKDNQDSKKRKETQSPNQPSKISKFQ